MKIRFTTAPETPPELLLWLEGAGASLSRLAHHVSTEPAGLLLDGRGASAVAGAHPDPDRAVMLEVEGEFRGSIRLDEMRGEVVATDREGQEGRSPFVVSAASFPAPRRGGSATRVLVRGSKDAADRRLRMLVKVVAEIRRRNVAHLFVCHGPFAPDVRSPGTFDEQYVDLRSDEWASLLAGAAAVLETSDVPGIVSPECRAALCLGVPVVTHRAVAARDEARGVFACDDWNADAFADTLSVATLDRRFEPSVDVERVLSDSLRFFGIGI